MENPRGILDRLPGLMVVICDDAISKPVACRDAFRGSTASWFRRTRFTLLWLYVGLRFVDLGDQWTGKVDVVPGDTSNSNCSAADVVNRWSPKTISSCPCDPLRVLFL